MNARARRVLLSQVGDVLADLPVFLTAPIYQRNSFGPMAHPRAAGISIPSTYHTARNGACISGQ